MIIRRRHTRNFVTLENALVRDRRLSLDEHGMLHYLLSLPDDWEVSRSNCAKFWGIGREKAGRIFRALRKTGWARVERIHGENGQYLGTRWIITDEPGEEVAEAELDAEPTEADDEGVEGEAAEAVLADHDTAEPGDGSAVVRPSHDAANPYRGHSIDSTKTDSEENRIPQNRAGARARDLSDEAPAPEPRFSDLLKIWPPDHVLSADASEQAWQRLARVDRSSVNGCAERYLDDCRLNSRKVCDLRTYIAERRDKRFVRGAAGSAVAFIAKPNTPQWHRWREYRAATGQTIALMESRAARGDGWTVPSEWPPPLPPKEPAPAPTVAPHLSDDDCEALANERVR